MGFLQNWVRGLVTLMVLLSLAELLLPQDSLKPYVRMMLGLLVVVGLVRPLLHEMTFWEPQVSVGETPLRADLESLKHIGDRVRENGAAAAGRAFFRETDVYRLLKERLPGLQGAAMDYQGGILWIRPGRNAPAISKEEILQVLRGSGLDQVKVEVIQGGE